MAGAVAVAMAMAPACGGPGVASHAALADAEAGYIVVTREASADADATDEAPLDAGPLVPLTPRLLVPGVASPCAITASGDVVFQNGTGYYAVPVSGGDATFALAFIPGSYSGYGAQGDFFWVVGGDKVGTTGAIGVWSRATGAATTSVNPSTAAPYPPRIDAAGARMIYEQIGATSGTVDVVGASVTFSDVTPLVSGLNELSYNHNGWVGETAVVGGEPWGPDATAGSLTLGAFSGASWASQPIAGDLPILPYGSPIFIGDPGGASVVAISTGGGATLFPLDGGPSTSIDPAASSLGYFLHDGRLLYATAGDVRVSSTTTPSPHILFGMPFGGFAGLSNDETWFVFSDAMPGGDMRLGSTLTSGPGVPVGAWASTSFGYDVFTADSRFALSITDFDGDTVSGTLTITAVAGGQRTAASSALGLGVWGMSGSQVLAIDNVVNDASDGLVGDLEWIDASGSTPTVTLAKTFPANVVVSDDRKYAAYYDDEGAWGPGLYVIEFP
ncbi:MAG TPA: hypothetical protein VIJ22_20555 [Polyangiaceae bacterium]